MIEETNQLYKVYFNKGYHPTLKEYFEYLCENLALTDPTTMVLKKQSGNYYTISSVDDFRNGMQLSLTRKDLLGVKSEDSPESASVKKRLMKEDEKAKNTKYESS